MFRYITHESSKSSACIRIVIELLIAVNTVANIIERFIHIHIYTYTKRNKICSWYTAGAHMHSLSSLVDCKCVCTRGQV